MPLLEIVSDGLTPVPPMPFAEAGMLERRDLQRLVRDHVHLVVPDVLVIAEEFGDWEDSRRRIDLLAIDRQANLVVIELKRTEDGGHMELQAIRYAAMVSAMTWRKAVDVFATYLARQGRTSDNAMELMLGFLGWDEPLESDFATDVRIILMAADFHPEITTTVMWLNAHGLDVACVRMTLYQRGDSRLLDIQPIIPLPEARDYQVRLREKSIQVTEQARSTGRDFTKYTVTTGDTTREHLAKRHAVFAIVRHLCERGVTPDAISRVLDWRKGRDWRVVEGSVGSDEFETAARASGRSFEPRRYFLADGELIQHAGKTYAFSNQWGEDTVRAMEGLVKAFPETEVSFRASV